MSIDTYRHNRMTYTLFRYLYQNYACFASHKINSIILAVERCKLQDLLKGAHAKQIFEFTWQITFIQQRK